MFYCLLRRKVAAAIPGVTCGEGWLRYLRLLVLVVASGSSASTRRNGSPARLARLSRDVAHLRAQLHAAKIARGKADASLAAVTAELQSSQEQLGAAQQQIAELQGQLGNLQGQVATLQVALSSVPVPLSAAIEQVRREVAYVRGGVSYSYGQLVSEAAMDYTVGHVSDTAYGYLEWFGGTLPGFDPNDILAAQAGICGQAANVFAGIVSAFGFPVRSVQFYYDDPGGIPDVHVTVEVYYDGGWHMFDPTYGQFWTASSGAVLSIADVRAGSGTLQKDVASFTNVFEDAVLGNDTWFVTDPATRVVIGADPLPYTN